MSEEANVILLERAADMMEFWTGTIMSELLHYAIAQDDLDLVHQYVKEAEALAEQQEVLAKELLCEE